MSHMDAAALAAWFQALYGGPPRGIIFDCDGVVIDSREANIAYYNYLRKFLGLPSLSPGQEDFVQAATVSQALDAIIPTALRPLLRDAGRQVSYERDILPRIACFPGLHETLELCRLAGLRTGMATNRTDGMEALLRQCDLQGCFDPIVLACDVPRPKPAPDGALFIASCWNEQPSHLLFVGDSPSDKGAAEGAGIPFLAFQTQGLAEHGIASFAALTAALRSLAHTVPQHFTDVHL